MALPSYPSPFLRKVRQWLGVMAVLGSIGVGMPGLQRLEERVQVRHHLVGPPGVLSSTAEREGAGTGNRLNTLKAWRLERLEQGNGGNRGESRPWVTLGVQEGRRPWPVQASILPHPAGRSCRPLPRPPEASRRAASCPSLQVPLSSPASRVQPPSAPAWASLLGSWPDFRLGCSGATA